MAERNSITIFTEEEYSKIKVLVGQLENSDRSKQKTIRAKIRRLGLYWRELTSLSYTIANLERLRHLGIIQVSENNAREKEIISSSPNVINSKVYKETEEPMKHNTYCNLSEIESLLINEDNFVKVSELVENDIPQTSGIYVIRINDINALPEEFSKILEQRKHNILYIGISEDNLKRRIWSEELHHENAATFFRSIGAVLGYRPSKNSLSLTNRNYKFSEKDTDEIIKWMEVNLLVNYISCDYGKEILESIEKELIKKYKPIINIKNNPYKLKVLKELRKQCIDIAHSK